MAEVSPEQQKTIIKDLMDNTKMKEGQEWYVVEFKWYQVWKFYVNYDGDNQGGSRPEPIDNTPLLEQPNTDKLRMGLREEYDYVVVPKVVWEKWQTWYGGGPKIMRQVITTGVSLKYRVDLYPISLVWFKLSAGSSETRKPEGIVQFSRTAKMKEVKRKIAGLVMSPPHKVRIWRIDTSSNSDEGWEVLDNEDTTLEELNIEDGTQIMAESKGHDGEWP